MSIFDDAFDEMSLTEVCYRLPGDLAVSAIKRRLNDLPSLLDFVNTAGHQTAAFKEVKDHVNSVISQATVPEILSTFDKETHPELFPYLNEENKSRIKNEGKASLDTKMLFNLASSKDLEALQLVLRQTLSQPTVKQSAVLAVLDKADSTIFSTLLDETLRDTRPEVKVCALAVASNNFGLVGEHQKIMALKALTKTTQNPQYVNILGLSTFTSLRPKERLDALTTYLNYFKPFSKSRVFEPRPSQEEFEMILFAGCIEHNDLVLQLNSRYKAIGSDRPLETDGEEA